MSLENLELFKDLNSPYITIAGKENNIVFKLLKSDCLISPFLTTIINDCDDGGSSPCLGISTEILKHIVDYINKKGGKLDVAVNQDLGTTMLESCSIWGMWEAQFIDHISDLNLLYSTVWAAEYFQINSLVHLVCAKIAIKLRGKSVLEIKTIIAAMN